MLVIRFFAAEIVTSGASTRKFLGMVLFGTLIWSVFKNRFR